MRFTAVMIESIGSHTIVINTANNHTFVGKVLEIDEDNLKISVAGAVGSTGGILNKERTTYISCDTVISFAILD